MKKIQILKAIFLALFTMFIITTFAEAQEISNRKEVKIKTSACTLKCKKMIESELNQIVGIGDASLNLQDQILTVEFNPEVISIEFIKNKLESFGYKAEILNSDDHNNHTRVKAKIEKVF